MTLASVVSIFSSPLVHGPILFIAIRLAAQISKKPKVFNFVSIIPLVWLLLCSMTYPSVLLIKYLEDQYPVISIQSEEWRKTDAIVVMACYYREDEELPFISRWPNCSLQRNVHAFLMYKAHHLPIYLAAGAMENESEYSLAQHNRSFFESLGVDSNNIFMTPKGFNTETESHALSKLLQGKTVSLVSSASHLPRAVRYFEEFGVKVLPIPVEHFSRIQIEPVIDFPNARSLYRSERAIHEYLGLIYQKYIR